MVNKSGEANYVKFHMKTNQGIKNLPAEKAHQISADDPDYSIHDLYNAIADGNFPSWTMYIQVMTFKEAETHKWNPFDLTKVWPQAEFPLQPVGKLVLNRNPENYFTEVEQIAFSPANMVPGIEPSPDKMLQGRLFSYTDTHRHRLGPNYAQLPVNAPDKICPRNTIRDGFANHDKKQGGAPNYFPNSFSGLKVTEDADVTPHQVSGDVKRYNTADDDNFSQVTLFWTKVLDEAARKRLVDNIVGSLSKATESFLKDRAVKNFTQVHPDFGKLVREGLDRVQKSAQKHHL